MKITVLADNRATAPFQSEHGLALMAELPSELLLFDTGAGSVLTGNLEQAGFCAADISKIVISHGHRDHTGGLSQILTPDSRAELFFGDGAGKRRYSLHPGKPVKELTLPPLAAAVLCDLPPRQKHIVTEFQEIAAGIFLTGPIPRNSFENCGGPFFLDPQGENPDLISDEIALLTAEGVLIQGCCHAGIINTLEYCRYHHPEIRIDTIIGGLHLLHSDISRLQKTAEYLNSLDLKKIILLHCTGEEAMAFLQQNLRYETIIGSCGDSYEL